MRKILIVIVLTVLVIFGIYFVQHRWNNENTEIGMAEKIDEVKEEPKEDITINMTVTGDVLCHNTNFFDAYNASTDSYDFSYTFEDIKNILIMPILLLVLWNLILLGKLLDIAIIHCLMHQNN